MFFIYMWKICSSKYLLNLICKVLNILYATTNYLVLLSYIQYHLTVGPDLRVLNFTAGA
jgi:hypothetical protein